MGRVIMVWMTVKVHYQINVIGSYLHGPILARSPQLADHLLSMALVVVGKATKIGSLDDSLENAAQKVAISRSR